MFSKIIFTATALSLSLSVFAAEKSEEATDRLIDQAAVDMQSEADADLGRAALQFRGTPREAEMLMRLSELRLEIAESLFRVAYGPKEKGIQAAYRAKLSSGVESLTRILSVHSNSEYYPRALFLRGKAEKELGLSEASLKDFSAFLARFSQREEAPVAALTVADLSIQAKNFKRAISVLAPLMSKPAHPVYPNALAKRAWAFFADDNPFAAVRELKLLAAHFNRLEKANKLSTGDIALRESLFSDVPSLAYSAFSKDPTHFSLASANKLLRSFDTDAGYRSMALRFMDHLRTSDRDGELRTWKGIVLKSDPARAENLQMLIATFEYDLEREFYSGVVKTAGEMAVLLSKNSAVEGGDEARNLIVRAAGTLTKRISDYRKNYKGSEAAKNLSALLTVFERITPAEDSRRIALRWNLAETYFGLKDFESAAQSYRSVALNWGPAKVTNTAVSPEVAALKAISSRYEALRAAGVIPKSLSAQASSRSNVKLSAAQMGLVREWIQWMEVYSKSDASALDHFQFEANRTLYQAGLQDEAMDRMKTLALSAPQSKVAIAAASLVIDTWIARTRWDRVEAESLVFSNVKGWEKPTFAAQMREQAAGAKFKRAEVAYATKNYLAAGEQAREFLKSYPDASLAIDANGIACNSALNSGDLSSAVDCFDGLASRFPKTLAATQALRTAARIEDDRMNFASASDRYIRYLQANRKVNAAESFTIRKRIVQLARASGDAERMMKSGSTKSLCAPRLQAECELNLALAALIRASDQNPAFALRKITSSRRELRAIWATVALDHWSRLDRRGLDRAVDALVSNWKSTDASVRYFLIARVTKILPAILQQERTLATRVTLTANAKAITTRMRLLQNIELRAKIAGQLPINAIQAAALETVYLGYNDLINDFRAMPTSPNATAAQKVEHQQLVAGLVHPLILKARKIRDSFAVLDLKEKQGLNPEAVDGLWDRPVAVSASHDSLRREWSKAIHDENWSRVSFLSDEVMELKNVPAGWAKAARAISLATAGASAEAGIVFGDACREASGSDSLRKVCRSKGRG